MLSQFSSTASTLTHKSEIVKILTLCQESDLFFASLKPVTALIRELDTQLSQLKGQFEDSSSHLMESKSANLAERLKNLTVQS